METRYVKARVEEYGSFKVKARIQDKEKRRRRRVGTGVGRR